MKKHKHKITIELPDEFVELCRDDLVQPERVLRSFIADLCCIINWQSDPRVDGYSSNGSDERNYARVYYDRVGYSYEAEYIRRANKIKSSGSQAAILNCRNRQKYLTPVNL